MNRNRSDEAKKEYVERLLSALNAENQVIARRLLIRRTNRARQWSSIHTWATSLRAMESAASGRPFVSVTADEWAAILAAELEKGEVARSTLAGRTTFVREFLRSALACKDLPTDLEDALSIYVDNDDTRIARVITEDEWRSLLEHVVHHESKYHSSRHIAMKLALLWAIDDTGYRCDELRSINVGQLQFRPDGSCLVKLCTKREAIARGCRLKRGPREIMFYKCVPLLQTWLAAHPRGHDPSAPLFLGFRDQAGTDRISKQVLNGWILQLGIGAGLTPIPGRDSLLSPHDFRHTRITRAAKQRPFNMPEFSMYFWGIPNSKECATYVHLTGEDLAAVARSNLGIDQYGYAAGKVEVGVPREQLIAQFRAIARALGLDGEGAAKP